MRARSQRGVLAAEVGEGNGGWGGIDSGVGRAHRGARGDARARGEGDAGHAREAAGVARAAARAARRVTRDARGGAAAAAAVVEVLAVRARADARAVVLG